MTMLIQKYPLLTTFNGDSMRKVYLTVIFFEFTAFSEDRDIAIWNEPNDTRKNILKDEVDGKVIIRAATLNKLVQYLASEKEKLYGNWHFHFLLKYFDRSKLYENLLIHIS